jgi:hypothetical protein
VGGIGVEFVAEFEFKGTDHGEEKRMEMSSFEIARKDGLFAEEIQDNTVRHSYRKRNCI